VETCTYALVNHYYRLGEVHKGSWTLKPVLGLRKRGSLFILRRNPKFGPSDKNSA